MLAKVLFVVVCVAGAAALPNCGVTDYAAASNATFVSGSAYTGPGTCEYAGYAPGSNVVPHAMIDLDQRDFETKIGNSDFAGAKAVYSGGGNSRKSSSNRTLKGFSTAGTGNKFINGQGSGNNYVNPTFAKFKAYYTDGDYADKFVMNALDSTTLPDAARKELAKKGSAYQNVWMYVIHEMEDAIADCKAGAVNNNDAGVHAWDEAWVFYAGSAQTVSNDTSTSSSGYLLYRLADKRCGNFGTCTPGTQRAKVNTELLPLFSQGRDALAQGNCTAAEPLRDSIIKKMTIPLVQGTLRYAYKADPQGGNEGDKERAEGWAFAAAVLPMIHACADKGVAKAKFIRDNMDFAAAAQVKDGYKEVYKAVQSTFTCLGITCADVGGLLDGSGGDFEGTRCTNVPTFTPPETNVPAGGTSASQRMVPSVFLALMASCLAAALSLSK